MCKKWIHLSCSSVDISFFNSNADWFCDICLFKQLPFNVEEDDTVAKIPCVPANNTFNYDDITYTYERLNEFNGLKIGHLNVCTIIKNLEEIESILVSSKIDILTISESRLDGTVQDSEISINGYTILRKDRNRNGGGVLMYIRNSIIFNTVEQFINDLEILCIKICLHKQKAFHLAVWYRPPDSNNDVFEQFECFLQYLDSQPFDFVITGDLNCDVSRKTPHNHTQKYSL